MTSLDALKALRESQGLSVALINVEDIYDEFGFGMKGAKAVKSFLKYASDHWTTKPRFVLLAGDATFDPRNFEAMGEYDFVPTKLLNTAYIETASDDWFVDFNDDGLPEMAMGRLPFRTPAEADTVVSKIVGYDQSATLNQALLVADLMEEGDYDFEAAATELAGMLPGHITSSQVFRGHYAEDTLVKDAIMAGINAGPLLVNYTGHGSIGTWRGEPSVFTSYDPASLTNGSNLPLFINMTCLNGAFHDIYADSLAESLVKSGTGGAVAVWSSSGLTEPEGQHLMNKEAFTLLFNGEGLTLGEVVKRSKAATTDEDIRKTWILLGDPAMTLKYQVP
jgi:hypothetical protein